LCREKKWAENKWLSRKYVNVCGGKKVGDWVVGTVYYRLEKFVGDWVFKKKSDEGEKSVIEKKIIIISGENVGDLLVKNKNWVGKKLSDWKGSHWVGKKKLVISMWK